jgi:hypothetical protein
MTHYAKVLNGIVQTVIVAEPEFFENFIDTSPGQWIETSANAKGGLYYDSSNNIDETQTALRGNFAGIGYTYDQQNDVFYAPRPYPSWTISAPTWIWEAPIPRPNDGTQREWDEATLSWVVLT